VPLLITLVASALLASCLPAPGAAQAAAGTDSFRVMTFNIQHGLDGSGRYNLQRAIDVIARLEPDIVALQEVTRNHSMYRCDDQPSVIADGLRKATGRAWHHAYVQAWQVNRDRRCMEQGRGDGPNTEGLALLAPEPLEAVTHVKLWNGRIGLAARVAASGGTTVIGTHLANGGKERSIRDRTRQLGKLLPWADALGTPRLLIGDFNARPDAMELTPITKQYRDAWSEAQSSRVARGAGDGATRTRGTGRVDFIFYTPADGLRLEWVETVDTRSLVGVTASDHRPVVASFRLSSPVITRR
jgi:endonuclease/exonuclease/phosphatase family metal-dependent hydrolase